MARIAPQGGRCKTQAKNLGQCAYSGEVVHPLERSDAGDKHRYSTGQHARRIEQISDNLLSINYGTIYPALLKLEQEGCISSDWGVSDNNRKAKYYTLTRSGR